MDTFALTDQPPENAESLASTARREAFFTLVGALVVRPDGRLFAQRRSLTRKFGPGLWDNVGGHIEGDETVHEALTREMQEETGWTLETIDRLIATRTWSDPRGISKEFIVLCTASGNLDAPALEEGKVDQFMWIGPSETRLLSEHRTDESQKDIYDHAFGLLAAQKAA